MFSLIVSNIGIEIEEPVTRCMVDFIIDCCWLVSAFFDITNLSESETA